MILEGFEIDNWSCIKHVAVDGLPSTGVIVLHGPNGTGKSSIIEALRACLMDKKSTTKSLERGFSKNCDEKPTVSVTFRAKGGSWKITKQFGTNKSRLESRPPNGQWKLETSDPSEAHDRTRDLTGGCDSNLGLHQLLWLTQAEFRLPEPKKFDADVQSNLRNVLGVLQTNLDDRFIGRVKEQWSNWFSARSKPGEKGKIKKDCPLAKRQSDLERLRQELQKIEADYQSYERMMGRSRDLEVLVRDLRRQHGEKSNARNALQEEYQRSLTRLERFRQTEKQVIDAEDALNRAKALRQRRDEAEKRIRDTEKQVEATRDALDEKTRLLQAAEQRLREHKHELQLHADEAREQQARSNEVSQRRQWLAAKASAKTARDTLQRAEQSLSDLEELKKQARERSAPDASTLKKLEDNRIRVTQLRAELDAAAIALFWVLDPDAARPILTIDGTSAPNDTSDRYLIRRRAELTIPGWGRAKIERGEDARDLGHIEQELGELERQFADGLALFGIAASDRTALDSLRSLAAEKKVRDPELKRKQDEFNRIAPQGLEPLQHELARLENLVQANEAAIGGVSLTDDLDRIAEQLTREISDTQARITSIEQRIVEVEREIDGAGATIPSTGKKTTKAERDRPANVGLRQQEADLRVRLAEMNVAVDLLRSELQRVPTAEQISTEIQSRETALASARQELESARLSESEGTIRERLDAAIEGLHAIDERLAETNKEYHNIEGALRHTEGLHQKRANAAARVEELARLTERESLESEAYDHLYALFEDCREKQLGTVMGPIHDRVVRWMKLLRIGGYQSIRFNDQFLPDKLLAANGAVELAIGEESTGTIEQIGLMVRLALGATLSTVDEPVTAILDDPLTHSDVTRLNLMRAVLKNAAAGDTSCTPPAGPLQIVVFTCHPEWFQVEGARVIDLGSAETLVRFG